MKKLPVKILMMLITTFVLLEAVVQIAGEDEGHRILLFGNISIDKPYDIEHWQEIYARYSDEDFWKTDTIYGGYDEQLGWNIFANRATANGLYKSNNQGLRGNKDCSVAKTDSVFRIGVFGDSFTHGNDVENEECWPSYLEQYLADKGMSVEVLNFGVMSYGIDQAYLKYKHQGAKFNCDLVVFGFQAENIFRSQNVFRPNYIPQAGIPLSKPIATLTGKELRWHNIPTMHPTKLLDSLIMNFESSSLAEYEYYDDNQLLAIPILDKFRAVLTIKTIIKKLKGIKNRTDISAASDACVVSQEIIRHFKGDVEAKGSDFMMVQLPNRSDLEEYHSTGQLHYETLLKDIKSAYGILRTDKILAAQPTGKVIDQHYTPLGNQLIAAYFADAIFENYATRPR